MYGIEDHSESTKSTYAYYFNESIKSPPEHSLWPKPDWAESTADHADEMLFMFGPAFLWEDEQASLWAGKCLTLSLINEMVAF